jgi:hypothetical protein
MLKIRNKLIFFTLILLASSCSKIGYVENRYENGILLRKNGVTSYYQIDNFGPYVTEGSLVVVKKKSVKVHKTYTPCRNVKTLN